MNAPDRSTLFARNPAPYIASNADQHHVCCDCVGDHALRQKVAASGAPGICVECGKSGSALAIAAIAVHLDELIKQRYYGSLPTDEEVYLGADLRSIVREVLDGERSWEDMIIDALKNHERNCQGEGTFYTDTALYEKRQLAHAAPGPQ